MTSKWSELPPPVHSDYQSRFGGAEWAVNSMGVYLRDSNGQPQRTAGEPLTCRDIATRFGQEIKIASIQCKVPAELLVMVIATESAAFASHGYTGPSTFRWEPHVKVMHEGTTWRGDYSCGPAQVLSSTARSTLKALGIASKVVEANFPALKERPVVPPEQLSGYRPSCSILAGGREIQRAWKRTKGNPILVAAAYNAGGLYDASSPTSRLHNRWHLRSYGNHLDRAARWYGDACAVLAELRERDQVTAAEVQYLVQVDPHDDRRVGIETVRGPEAAAREAVFDDLHNHDTATYIYEPLVEAPDGRTWAFCAEVEYPEPVITIREVSK